MGRNLLPLLCLALGLVGGVAGALLAPRGEPVRGTAAPSGEAPGPTSGDLARLERRVEELAAAAPAGRREGGANPSAAPAPGPGDADRDAAPGDRVAALEARVAALETAARGGIEIPKDLAKVPSRELFDLAKRLAGMKHDSEALDLLAEALRRGDLDEKVRTDAEMQVGYSLRTLGRHAEAEARFRETLARVGEGSEAGGHANFQIGWERSFQGDPAGAATAMERAADNAQSHVNVRIQGLLRAAQWARAAGDDVRARNDVDRLLREFGDAIPESQPAIRQQAEALQKELAAK